MRSSYIKWVRYKFTTLMPMKIETLIRAKVLPSIQIQVTHQANYQEICNQSIVLKVCPNLGGILQQRVKILECRHQKTYFKAIQSPCFKPKILQFYLMFQVINPHFNKTPNLNYKNLEKLWGPNPQNLCRKPSKGGMKTNSNRG